MATIIKMATSTQLNRPFPSSPQSPFQSESKSEIFVMIIILISLWMKTDFYKKGFALSLALKWRLRWTRKWPISQDMMARRATSGNKNNGNYSGVQRTVEKPIPKWLLQPIGTGAKSTTVQSEFVAITCNLLKALIKLRVQGTIGFGFAFYSSKHWRQIFKPITKCNNGNGGRVA